MKKVFGCILILIMAALYPMGSRAQFLKNLVNNVKQNMANKAVGNNTGTAGKPDSAGRMTANDSAMLVGIMAKMNAAVKPVPMTAEDSAAIKSFMTASGGSGILYQYQTRYDFKGKTRDSSVVDTMSTAISDAHNTHVDMNMLGMKMTVIGHAGQPKYSVILYPGMKGYKLNIIDTAAINGGPASYQVTRVGVETVAGYSCVHSRMVITTGKNANVTEDIWTSNTVPGYAQLKKMMTNQNVTPKMMQAMEKAGCDGMIVKMQVQTVQQGTQTSQGSQGSQGSPVQSMQFSMDMVLITAARKDFPASMFEIPAGYTAMNTQNMFGNMMMMQQQKQK
jgi:hypothetical protein